jgi:glycerol transport system ATP-binding protein
MLSASVPEALSIDGDRAALAFDPLHIHIYADGHLVAGEPIQGGQAMVLERTGGRPS